MDLEINQNRNVAYLDAALLDERGLLRVLPAAELAAIDRMDLRVFAHNHGIYQFPTTELVDWLAKAIAGTKAIEIGAGHGAIARALGIPATDSHQQADPKYAMQYAAMGQPVVRYPADVAKQDASEAVRLRSPHTAIGAWITQKFRRGDTHGNEVGVDEEWLLRRVKRYILIGNEHTHGDKRIMARPHQTYAFPWLVSRAIDPRLNRIYVWENP